MMARTSHCKASSSQWKLRINSVVEPTIHWPTSQSIAQLFSPWPHSHAQCDLQKLHTLQFVYQWCPFGGLSPGWQYLAYVLTALSARDGYPSQNCIFSSITQEPNFSFQGCC
jgi:hypothetical protein